jgi:hypothetical protein
MKKRSKLINFARGVFLAAELAGAGVLFVGAGTSDAAVEQQRRLANPSNRRTYAEMPEEQYQAKVDFVKESEKNANSLFKLGGALMIGGLAGSALLINRKDEKSL